MSVEPARPPVFRVTPMMVLADITPALARYEALGFERVETGDAGCIGLRAGQTAVILASTSFVRGDFGAGLAIPWALLVSVALLGTGVAARAGLYPAREVGRLPLVASFKQFE